MAKRPTTDPALRDLKQELLRTTDALKDAYTRFNCVCDSELIEASIYEISALKAAANTCCAASRSSAARRCPPPSPAPSRCRPRRSPPRRREPPAWLPVP